MAVIHVCSGGCGANALGSDTGSRHWSAFPGAGPKTVETTIVPAAGEFAWKFDGTGGVASNLSLTVSQSVVAGRMYFRVPSAPSANGTIISSTAAAGLGPIIRLMTDLKLNARWGTSGAGTDSSVTLSVDTYYRIDWLFNMTTGTIDWQIDGAAQTQVTVSQSATTATDIEVGMISVGLSIVGYVSRIIFGDNTSDYPFGAGKSAALHMGSDGTHNASAATDFLSNGTTNIPTNATNTFGFINGRFDSSTEFVAAAAAATGEYLEWVIETPPSDIDTIHGMSVVSVVNSAATAANKHSMKIVDGGTEEFIFEDADFSFTGFGHHHKFYNTAPSGGAITPAKLAALKFRWGSSWTSTDVTPDPQLNALIVEIDYEPATGIPVTGGTIASTLQFFAPTLAYAVTAGTRATTVALFAPTVALTLAVTTGTIPSAASVNSPTISYVVTTGTITSTVVVSAPTLTYVVQLPAISGTSLSPPSLAYAVTAGTRASANVLFAPSLVYVVTTGSISATSLFAPTIANTQLVTTGTVSATVLYVPTLAYVVTTGTVSATQLFAPTVTPPDIDVTGGHVTSTVIVFAPTLAYAITTGHISGTIVFAPSLAYEITTGSIASTIQLFVPTITYAITAGTITSENVVFAPTLEYAVTTGTISATLLFAPTVINTQLVTTGHISETAVFAPALSAPDTIFTGTISATVLFAPTLAYAVTVGHVSATVIFAPSIAYDISAGTVGSTVILYAPELYPEQVITTGTVTPGTILFEPTIVNTQVVTTGTVSATVLYPPTLSVEGGVSTGEIPSGSVLYAPAIAYAITAGTISETILFAPSIEYIVITGTIPSGNAVFAPTLEYAVTTGSINAGTILFAPTVSIGAADQAVIAGTVPTSIQLFAPSLTYQVTAGFRSSQLVMFAPSVGWAVTGGFRASAYVMYAPSVESLPLIHIPQTGVLVQPSETGLRFRFAVYPSTDEQFMQSDYRTTGVDIASSHTGVVIEPSITGAG